MNYFLKGQAYPVSLNSAPADWMAEQNTVVLGNPAKSDYLDNSFINSAAYRIVQANKFVLMPPVDSKLLVVMDEKEVERLRKSVGKDRRFTSCA